MLSCQAESSSFLPSFSLFLGLVHHVQGRQIRDSSVSHHHNRFDRHGHSHHHHHGHGHGIHAIPNVAAAHQYNSYEEFQRAMENPFETPNAGYNLTVPLGDTAFLRCKVRSGAGGERSVRSFLLTFHFLKNRLIFDISDSTFFLV